MWGEGQEDAQNVSACARLIASIAKLGTKSVNDFPNLKGGSNFKAIYDAMLILAEYSACMFEVVLTQHVTGGYLALPVLVRRADQLAHMALVLFRESGSKFVPPQHYFNLQTMLKAPHITIATSSVHGIRDYFWYQDADDRLEGFFGMERVLEAGSNFDLLQKEERATMLMRLDKLYTLHPEMRKGSKRQVGSMQFDHTNPKTIASKSGRAPIDVGSVNLVNCWSMGAADADATLTRNDVFSSAHTNWREISLETNAAGRCPDMLRPHGDWVGVTDTSEDEMALAAAEQRPPPSNSSSADAVWVEEVLEDMCDQYTEPAEPGGGAQPGAQPESAIAPVHPTRIKLPKIYDYPGFPEGISVDQAPKLARGTADKKARERCARVMGRAMAGTKASGDASLEPAEGPRLLARVDPVVVLVRGPKGVSAVLAEPQTFKISDVISDEISASELPTARITAAVLRPRSTLVQGSLVFASGTTGDALVFDGVAATPVSPEIKYRDDGSVEWRIGRDILELMSNIKWSDMPEAVAAKLPAVRDETLLLPAAVTNGRGTDGVVYMEGSATLEEQERKNRAETGDSVTCELCKKKLTKAAIRQHMGAHILFEDDAQWLERYRIGKPDFPCGLCGTRAALGKQGDSSSSMCTVSVTTFAEKGRGRGKGRKTVKPLHQCQHVGKLEYDLGPAAKVSTTTPCTNRPIMCSVCSDVTVWTYSLAKHFETLHPGIAMPPDMKAASTLGHHERDWMKLRKSGGAVKKCTQKECPCNNDGE